MSGFTFDFNDTKRQVANTPMTEDEIDELIAELERRKNSKASQLSREEQALLLCCQQYRSYSKNKDVDLLVCPVCGSVHLIKNGTKNGKQRYKCKDCGKYFGDKYGTVVYHSRLPINKWINLIVMTLQGESCRTIARNVRVNKSTVLYHRYRICAVLQQLFCNQDDFQSLAEGDEYYYPLSFKDQKDPMFFLEVLGRMPYTHRSKAKKYEYVEKQGFDPSVYDHLKENKELCKEELLWYVNEEDLKSQEKFSIAVNSLGHLNPDALIQVLKTLNEQQKKKRGISNQQVCCLTCVDRDKNHFFQTVCVGRIQVHHIEKVLVPHFTSGTVLITDSHGAYKTVANKYQIPLKQVPSGHYVFNGYHLGDVNGYHRNISEFLHGYYGVSSKYLDYYLALCYWREKHRDSPYLEQAHDIMTLLCNQVKKIPLHKFKDKGIAFDLKGILGKYQGYAVG